MPFLHVVNDGHVVVAFRPGHLINAEELQASQLCRRIEFKKANKAGKELLTGTHYLVLKNADKLDESQTLKSNHQPAW
ncbi:unnamed protein product [marine sediment metagenome]|uniref:Uncharacterized protein n=1 Tax=marine sediment metagenome TaxID=412755 RepID=X1E9N2_9ZZZZ